MNPNMTQILDEEHDPLHELQDMLKHKMNENVKEFVSKFNRQLLTVKLKDDPSRFISSWYRTASLALLYSCDDDALDDDEDVQIFFKITRPSYPVNNRITYVADGEVVTVSSSTLAGRVNTYLFYDPERNYQPRNSYTVADYSNDALSSDRLDGIIDHNFRYYVYSFQNPPFRCNRCLSTEHSAYYCPRPPPRNFKLPTGQEEYSKCICCGCYGHVNCKGSAMQKIDGLYLDESSILPYIPDGALTFDPEDVQDEMLKKIYNIDFED